MLRIFRLTAITALLAALWASLLNRTDLGDLHHRLVLYVGARAGWLGAQAQITSMSNSSCLPSPAGPCPQSPVLALLGFGAYLAAALLYGVLTFQTVPEEAESLAKVRRGGSGAPGGSGRTVFFRCSHQQMPP